MTRSATVVDWTPAPRERRRSISGGDCWMAICCLPSIAFIGTRSASAARPLRPARLMAVAAVALSEDPVPIGFHGYGVPAAVLRLIACAAASPHPALPVDILRVGLVVGMAAWALCLRGVYGTEGRAAHLVLTVGDEVEMIRVDAGAVAADRVVYHEAFRDWSAKEQPRNVMRGLARAVDGEAAIAFGVDVAGPEPAAIRLRGNVLEEILEIG